MISSKGKLLVTVGFLNLRQKYNSINMVKARKFVYKHQFVGEPKLTDFALEEENYQICKREFLAESLYHSVDPYMVSYLKRLPTGITMIGGTIAKITDSQNKQYPVNSVVYGHFGWRSHTIVNPSLPPVDNFPMYIQPSFGNLPISLGLGVLGMPGNTAYFGLMRICKPKSGEIVVVSGAAGAVGSIVGQIAKIIGCTVIGIAGTNEKCTWLTDSLGFDYAINYKTSDIGKEIAGLAPYGVDCYFDNVGGQISATIIQKMREFGRIAVCGAMSMYNSTENRVVAAVQPVFIFKQLMMEGFLFSRYMDNWFEGIEQMRQWIDEGKIKYKEAEVVGFERLPEALIGMLRGDNIGKTIVKAAL